METRNCQNCKKDFNIESDDFDFYLKLKVPPPTFCPDCRFLRRLSFINERSLYGKDHCGNCKKPIISMYSPDVTFPRWCVKCHISDIWDARDYGKEYDFSKNFFEQFKELKYSIPHRALDQNERNGEGCDYANLCYTSKDIYLSFDTIGSEHIKYSSHVMKENKNCVDCMLIKANDRGYELVQSIQNYNSSFLIESDQCVESHFLYDCSNCVNCCLSSNLRNKSYVFRNEQLSREEYLKAISELKLETYSGQQKSNEEFKQISKKAVHKHAHLTNTVDVIGDFIENSKNLKYCYGFARNSENIKFGFLGAGTAKDCLDVTMIGKVEECYEYTLGGRGANKVLFSMGCGGSTKESSYCDNCRGCSDCFGCVSLLNKRYCILNKQYTEDEYFPMVEKIKKQMNDIPFIDFQGNKYTYGEFFPPEISPFAYNETIAYEEAPLTKTEVVALGYKWKDADVKAYIPTIKSAEISDNINDVKDDICDQIVECPNLGKVENQCTGAFRILPDELEFYRQMKLPLPRYCPNCRYHERLQWKNPFRFYKRECMCQVKSHGHAEKCSNKFETMYSPDKPEIIYCKECYQKEVL